MEGLVEQLADHYLTTVESTGDASRATPSAWRAAHRVAARAPISAAETIRLGVNAHISNDLPQAAATLLLAEWPLSNLRLERHYQDLCLYTEMVGTAAGMLDVMACWRAECWEHAIALATAADGTWRVAMAEQVECTAARRAHLIACCIPMRDHLLGLAAADLSRLFPHQHGGDECNLNEPAPGWGGSRLAAAAP